MSPSELHAQIPQDVYRQEVFEDTLFTQPSTTSRPVTMQRQHACTNGKPQVGRTLQLQFSHCSAPSDHIQDMWPACKTTKPLRAVAQEDTRQAQDTAVSPGNHLCSRCPPLRWHRRQAAATRRRRFRSGHHPHPRPAARKRPAGPARQARRRAQRPRQGEATCRLPRPGTSARDSWNVRTRIHPVRVR